MARAATLTAVPVYLTCGEVDKTYRMREGTAKAACDAGLIACTPRNRGRGTFLIRLTDAERMWGAK